MLCFFAVLLVICSNLSTSHPTRLGYNRTPTGETPPLLRRSYIAGRGECSPSQREIITEIITEASRWSRFSRTQQYREPSQASKYADIFWTYFGFHPHEAMNNEQDNFRESVDLRFFSLWSEMSNLDRGRILVRCDRRGNLGCREGAWSVMANEESEHQPFRVGEGRLSWTTPRPNQIILVINPSSAFSYLRFSA